MLGTTIAIATCLLSTTVGQDTMNLDFPGGSVNQWVSAIKTAAPSANIVVEQAANEVRIPAMHLQEVTLSAVMQVSEAQWDSPIICEQVQTQGTPVWVVTSAGTLTKGRSGRPTRTKLITGVFQLPQGIIEQDEVQLLVDAVQAVADLDADRPISIRVLSNVGLIAIRGGADQINTAAEVIEAIDHVQLRKRHAAATRPDRTTRAPSVRQVFMPTGSGATRVRRLGATPAGRSAATTSRRSDKRARGATALEAFGWLPRKRPTATWMVGQSP